MIRIEITKTVWQTETGICATSKPIVQDGVQYIEQRQVLLVQEFDDLRIEPIVALLNQLHETPLCTCGHVDTVHEGKIGRCSAAPVDATTYTSRKCDCRGYRTRVQARVESAERMAVEMATKSEATLAESKARLGTAEKEIDRLTRSRDSLLRRSKKSGAKRR